MPGELAAWGENVSQVVSPANRKKMLDQAGLAAKRIATNAAPPLRNAAKYRSPFGRKLTAGYDHTGPTEVTVNHRPGSVWSLHDQGRRGMGRIFHRGSMRRVSARSSVEKGAVNGPVFIPGVGFRAYSRYFPSAPPHPNLIRNTFGKERTAASRAAAAVFTAAVASSVRSGVRAGSVGSGSIGGSFDVD